MINSFIENMRKIVAIVSTVIIIVNPVQTPHVWKICDCALVMLESVCL